MCFNTTFFEVLHLLLKTIKEYARRYFTIMASVQNQCMFVLQLSIQSDKISGDRNYDYGTEVVMV